MTKVFQHYLREGHNKTVSHSENIFPLPLGRKLSTAFNAAALSMQRTSRYFAVDGLAECPIYRNRFSDGLQEAGNGRPVSGVWV